MEPGCRRRRARHILAIGGPSALPTIAARWFLDFPGRWGSADSGCPPAPAPAPSPPLLHTSHLHAFISHRRRPFPSVRRALALRARETLASPLSSPLFPFPPPAGREVLKAGFPRFAKGTVPMRAPGDGTCGRPSIRTPRCTAAVQPQEPRRGQLQSCAGSDAA